MKKDAWACVCLCTHNKVRNLLVSALCMHTCMCGCSRCTCRGTCILPKTEIYAAHVWYVSSCVRERERHRERKREICHYILSVQHASACVPHGCAHGRLRTSDMHACSTGVFIQKAATYPISIPRMKGHTQDDANMLSHKMKRGST